MPSNLLVCRFDKTERILVLHAMSRPTLKKFLVQEAYHGYWTAFLDVKRFYFCEKDNRNLEMDYSNFPVLHRELLLPKQIFSES